MPNQTAEDLLFVNGVVPDSRLLQRLYEDWNIRRRGRDCPARCDFDPTSLKYILGNLSLVEVYYQPLRFRWRVHGTNVAERLKFDLSRKFLDELPDRIYKKLLHEHYEAVIKQRLPVLARRRHRFPENRLWDYEALALPLSDDGTTVNMLWSGVDFIVPPASKF